MLQRLDITLDRFLDILDRLRLRFALGNATGQAGTLGHPITVLTRIKNDLAHGIKLTSGKHPSTFPLESEMPPSAFDSSSHSAMR